MSVIMTGAKYRYSADFNPIYYILALNVQVAIISFITYGIQRNIGHKD